MDHDPGADHGRATDRALGPRDLELLRLIAQGHTGDRLSRELRAHPRTIQRRISVIRDALDCRTTIEAVVEAVRRGLI